MSEYLYDAKTNGFYPLSLKEDYEAKGTWPSGGVEISEDEFMEFQSPPNGMVRIAGDDGHPAWGEIPPPSKEQQITAGRLDQQRLIDAANAYISGKQWPGKAAIGRLKGDELAQYNIWLDYLDALEAVDTSSAPNIGWPAQPEA